MIRRREDLNDLFAGKPAQQIDEMAARVDQRRRVVGLAPAVVAEGARGQVVHVIAFEIRQGAERAGVDQRFDALVQRHEPHLVDDGDDLRRRGRRGALDRAQPLD